MPKAKALDSKSKAKALDSKISTFQFCRKVKCNYILFNGIMSSTIQSFQIQNAGQEKAPCRPPTKATKTFNGVYFPKHTNWDKPIPNVPSSQFDHTMHRHPNGHSHGIRHTLICHSGNLFVEAELCICRLQKP